MLGLAYPPIKLNPPQKKRHAHQFAACRDMDAAFERGHQDVLLRGSTGVGKTLTLSGYAMEQAIAQKRVVIVMGLTTLPDQWRDALIDLGYPAHEIGRVGDSKVINPAAHISIVMIKTLANRLHVLEAMQPDMVIVDEAHELYFNSFLDRLREQEWNKAKWVWATATPWRLNKREAFTRIQKEAVVEILGSMREVIKAGHLTPIRLFNRGGLRAADIAKLELSSNDTLKSVDAAKLKTPEFIETCISEIWEHNDRYRAAGLCVDIEQCEIVTATWNLIHPEKPATLLHSELASGEWDARLKGWQSGEYWIAFSVAQFLTGFDYPPLDLLSWLRPTNSPIAWIQGCGRAARLSHKTGKVDAIILDHVGNRLRVGHPLSVAEKPPQLEPNTKEKRTPEKECPNCGEVVFSFVSICPCCGHQFGVAQLEIDGGEEMPMGEVIDPAFAEAITLARGHLKGAYTSWMNESKLVQRDKIINKLASEFPAEHMAGNLYPWLQGAVFRGDASAVAQYEMLRYLNALQPCNPNWVLHHFAIEFGFRVSSSAAVSPFQLLGLPDDSPQEWVERRYKLLTSQYQLEVDTSRLLEWAYRQAIALPQEPTRIAS